jgi:hypothetical protein
MEKARLYGGLFFCLLPVGYFQQKLNILVSFQYEALILLLPKLL